MRLPIAVVVISLAASQARGQERLAGNWEGYWTRAGDTMRVTLNVRRDADSSRYSVTFAADRLRVADIPFNDVRLDRCCDVTMTLRGDRTTAVFTGKLNGDSLTGALRESTGDGQFAFARAASSAPSFDEREVMFMSGAVTLAGTLLLPRRNNAVPAVVFVHGSGAEGRWASRYLAAQLANRGIAALIFDKRGVGGSSGDWRTASLEDLAADGAAAVAYLRRAQGIDSGRVGLHGHSQGGTLAPLIATRARNVAFIVGSAAAGVPTDSTEIYSILNSVYPRATSAEDSASARAYVHALVAAAYHGQSRARLDSLVPLLRDRPWFFAPPPPDNAYWAFSPMYAKYNALEWWSQVRVPVLLVYGGNDHRVPALPSGQRIEAALRSARNTDVTVRIYAGADHTFRMPPGPGGWPVTAPGYTSDLLDWLAKR